MQLVYEGVDITENVSIMGANVTDCAGGRADTAEIRFSDTYGLWSKWKPQKGHTVELTEGGFTSGLMYLDELRQIPGAYLVKAISTPLTAKTNRTRSWKQVKFLEIATDVAKNLGLTLQANVTDHSYNWIWQNDETDLEFLNQIALREGYMVKVHAGKLLIYDERQLEVMVPQVTYSPEFCIGDWKYVDSANGLKASCKVAYKDTTGKLTSYEFTVPGLLGGILKINDEYLSSIAEAERWSKGHLRLTNKNLCTMVMSVKLNTGLAGGSTVKLTGFGAADGDFYVEKAVHCLTDDITYMGLRRPLEGY